MAAVTAPSALSLSVPAELSAAVPAVSPLAMTRLPDVVVSARLPAPVSSAPLTVSASPSVSAKPPASAFVNAPSVAMKFEPFRFVPAAD